MRVESDVKVQEIDTNQLSLPTTKGIVPNLSFVFTSYKQLTPIMSITMRKSETRTPGREAGAFAMLLNKRLPVTLVSCITRISDSGASEM
jgi:hypothetical protein